MTAQPRNEQGLTIHFFLIDQQRTLCGRTLGDFAVHEWWTSVPETAREKVNCPDCLAERARRQTAVANARG